MLLRAKAPQIDERADGWIEGAAGFVRDARSAFENGAELIRDLRGGAGGKIVETRDLSAAVPRRHLGDYSIERRLQCGLRGADIEAQWRDSANLPTRAHGLARPRDKRRTDWLLQLYVARCDDAAAGLAHLWRDSEAHLPEFALALRGRGLRRAVPLKRYTHDFVAAAFARGFHGDRVLAGSELTKRDV